MGPIYNPSHASHLQKWTQGKIKYLPSAIPMVWLETASYENCYFSDSFKSMFPMIKCSLLK